VKGANMTRKFFPAILICLLLATLVTTTVLAGKTYRAERFDVQLDIQSGGGMLVTETVAFRFDGGPFTYAFREISANGTDGLTFLEASLDGAPMPQGTGAGQVEVETGDPLKVTWHFAPTSDATHVFVVRYRVAGVVSTGAQDTLRWYVISPDHGYSIDKTTITLNYPEGVRPLEAPALDREFDSAPTDTGFRLTAAGVADDESVILTTRFPAGSLVKTAPQWQAKEQESAAAAARTLPVGLLSGLATLLLGGFGLFAYIRANRRELNVPEKTLLPNPPADLPPALAGKLTGASTNFMGTIFDLAQRGLLEVREEKDSWGSKKHILERKAVDIALTPYEQGLLEAVFKPGEIQVSLSEVGTRLAYGSSQVDLPLEQELIQRGWLDPERKQKRARLVAVSLLVMFAGLGMLIGAAIATGVFLISNQALAWFTVALAGLGGGAFVLSIPLLIYASAYSQLTPAGEEQKMHWNSFRSYLDQVSHGVEPAVRPETFERYLAFAAVFGLGAAWAKSFQNLGGVPLPAWFLSPSGSDGDFGAMVAVMTASDTATYTGGADGGGGASGGGSSGAG
jgi:uncharacterized protein (TIGR04222 family)